MDALLLQTVVLIQLFAHYQSVNAIAVPLHGLLGLPEVDARVCPKLDRSLGERLQLYLPCALPFEFVIQVLGMGSSLNPGSDPEVQFI